MALFSPETMALFPVADVPMKKHYGGSKSDTMPAFHFRGSLATLMEALRVEYARPGSPLREYLGQHFTRWAGMENQETLSECLESAFCKTAFEAFEKEKQHIQTPLKHGKNQLSPVGSAFSMGRVMSGHPVASYRRPRVQLPAKVIDCTLSVSACVEHQAVSASMAKITNAAFRYNAAGGPMILRCHYLLIFRSANAETGAQGLVLSVDIPLTNGALASFGGSVQFFRAFAIPLAQALSGYEHDSLQCGQWTKKGALGIHGKANDGASTIEALRITGD